MIKTYQAPLCRQNILPEIATKENITHARAGVIGMLLALFAMGKKVGKPVFTTGDAATTLF